jgi:hypothetical protein
LDPRVTALARSISNCTVNYRAVLSSERALKIINSLPSKGNSKEKEKLVEGPRWAPDWSTDCRSYINFNFNFNFNFS